MRHLVLACQEEAGDLEVMVEGEGGAKAHRAYGHKRRCIDVAEVLVCEAAQERFGLAFPIFTDKDAVGESARAHTPKKLLSGEVTKPHAEKRVAFANDVITGDQLFFAFEDPSEDPRGLSVATIARICQRIPR